MKHIYDIEALMHKTGVTDYKELQSLGYDVIFYLKEKQQILQSKIDDLQQEINKIEVELINEHEERLNKTQRHNQQGTKCIKLHSDYSDDGFGPDMGFDESRIGDSDYVYIGT